MLVLYTHITMQMLTIEKNMQDVKKCSFNNGMQAPWVDGDADRVAAMTKQGDPIPGDKLLASLAKRINSAIIVLR